ncbi:MAG: DUF5615 family PIN-like protein [bacterium]|nr:DUF5615 family PIN-like protein [bacterium]
MAYLEFAYPKIFILRAIQGCSDQHIYEVCCSERRCLVTLDLDFADVTCFPPVQASGIVVIRVPRNPSLAMRRRLSSEKEKHFQP